MTTPIRKKLIEVSIPLEAINTEARRRKQKAPKGYPTSVHKYWAQRPVAACRAVLFAQLVDDPSAWPSRFSTDEAVEDERKRLHGLVERLVPWEASGNAVILNEARWEIARSIAWGRGEEPPSISDPNAVAAYVKQLGPTVWDPFSGAASIPMEAQRLGLGVRGSDLNPVAVLIGKALVEVPARFAGASPVNRATRGGQLQKEGLKWRGAAGLADDVRHYAARLKELATSRLDEHYPDIPMEGGPSARAVAYMWVRTVRSPDPRAKGAPVPLASSFLLSAKGGRSTWIRPVVSRGEDGTFTFEVCSGVPSIDEAVQIKAGTKAPGRGSSFICLLTGATISGEYIKAEGKAGRLGQRLMAVVVQTGRSRTYVAGTPEQEAIACLSTNETLVEDLRAGDFSLPVPERLTGGTCYSYGLDTFGKLYTDRQLLALSTFTDLLSEVRLEVEQEAREAAMGGDGVGLSDGGSGATAYADAIVTYLTLAVGRMALYGSTLCRWLTKDNALGSAIPQKGLEMTWDFSEANFLGDSSASIITCASNVAECLLSWDYAGRDDASINLADARFIDAPNKIVWNTDPPYYDNIAYADLSDYFYIWHRRALVQIWPSLYRRISTNKDDELTALSYRERRPDGASDAEWAALGPREKAEQFFVGAIGEAFKTMQRLGDEQYPAVIYYAFRQQAQSDEGTTSAGWSAVLQALMDAQFAIDGTWPLRTELTSALKANITALASSIVLVCRKRAVDAPAITRADLVRALKNELPEAIQAIRKAGVGPVDMQQSVIGPGMGVFSRYSRVLEDDDSEMSVKTALALINRVWADIDNELDEAFDPETQVALAWYSTYGFDAKPSGELVTLANAKNTPAGGLFSAGVFKDLKGKAALTPRDGLPPGWSPAADKTLTVWECVQHTARVLNAEEGGGEAASKLVGQMGSKAEEARALAYRLFEISTAKGWVSEALIYNELAQEWPKLQDLATRVADGAGTLGEQPTFEF